MAALALSLRSTFADSSRARPSCSCQWLESFVDGRARALAAVTYGRLIKTRKAAQRYYTKNSSEVRDPKKKLANLYVQRTQKVPLPTHVDAAGKPKPLSEFLCQPAGMESMLNTKALQSHEYLGSNTFRCILPKLEFLNFEVAPMVDLSVVANEQECIVEMLSCKFQGSEAIEKQNQRFTASMRNELTWESNSKNSTLEVNVQLNVSLEVYTLPFTLLPISAVETPGNAILQAMVDRMVPIFLDQLFDDYLKWAQVEDTTTHAGDQGLGKLPESQVSSRTVSS